MLTPQPRRAALYAIYAWMRCADDLADESPGPVTASLRLADFRAQTQQILNQPEAPHDDSSLWPAFAWAVKNYSIQHQWLDDALTGLMADQQGLTITTKHELDTYCYQVAGTVGMICTAIWRSGVPRDGADWAKALDLAQLRGRAFQYTNILRDIRSDAALTPARVYLPSDSFREFDLAPESLLKWHDPERCTSFINHWCRETADLYDQTTELESLIPADCRASLVTMTRLYRTLLNRIARHPEQIATSQRIRVPLVEKLRIVGEQLMATRNSPRPTPGPSRSLAQ